MGLLRIPFRRKKNKRIFTDEGLDNAIVSLEVATDLLKARIAAFEALYNIDPLVSIEDAADRFWEPKAKKPKAKEPKVKKPKRRDRTGDGRYRFTSKTAAADLTEWFKRRSNKWLTKQQIRTMSTSPLKGIPHASFYRAVELAGIEIDRTKRPHKFRLKKFTPKQVTPKVELLYGVSLTTIKQQLKGTKTSLTLHRSDCHWNERKGGEWLYANSLSNLQRKIEKLFDSYSDNGKTPVTNHCVSCVKSGRLSPDGGTW